MLGITRKGRTPTTPFRNLHIDNLSRIFIIPEGKRLHCCFLFPHVRSWLFHLCTCIYLDPALLPTKQREHKTTQKNSKSQQLIQKTNCYKKIKKKINPIFFHPIQFGLLSVLPLVLKSSQPPHPHRRRRRSIPILLGITHTFAYSSQLVPFLVRKINRPLCELMDGAFVGFMHDGQGR